jgi:predicted DNA-binding transcriptional regulator AlpA
MQAKSQIAIIREAIESNPANQGPSSLPRLLFAEDLSKVTGLSLTTIRHYTGNAQKFGHLLPKWFKLPGARRLVWAESDVHEFIRAGQATAIQPKRRRGRPTKAEQLAHENRNVEGQASSI